ncbi:MAG: aminopeptidase P family N-terminal domain-containing protein, partial [Thermoplasmata archaeon]|nr:aminopeptidase P family N-terminal domain-containing protein [Thermoplasmata archaeon]
MESRVKRLFDKIDDKKPDVIALANATDPMLDKTFFYATALGTSGVFEGSYLFCFPDGKLEMVTSILEEESARKGDFPVHTFKTQEERKEHIGKYLASADSVGINARELVHSQYMLLKELAPKAEFIDISKAVRDARVVKDEAEIEATRVACRIASQAAEEIIPFIKP